MGSRVLVIVIGAAALAGGSAHAGPLYLVRDGKPRATIVIAEDAGNYQKWAAQWLRDYVKRASGAALPIVTEGQAPDGTLISVGHTRMAAEAGVRTDDLEYDGCRLLVKTNVLYLIGRDAAPSQDKRPHTNRAGPQGTIRAVTTFLQDVVGVRWFLPGPEGIVVPATKDISVPARFAKVFVPATGYYEGRTPYNNAIADYALNFRSAIRYLPRGGHSWEVHVGDNVAHIRQQIRMRQRHELRQRLRPAGQQYRRRLADGRIAKAAPVQPCPQPRPQLGRQRDSRGH